MKISMLNEKLVITGNTRSIPSMELVTKIDWTLERLAVESRHIRFLAKEIEVGAPIINCALSRPLFL